MQSRESPSALLPQNAAPHQALTPQDEFLRKSEEKEAAILISGGFSNFTILCEYTSRMTPEARKGSAQEGTVLQFQVVMATNHHKSNCVSNCISHFTHQEGQQPQCYH